jgi:hypothetical protein
MKKFQITFDSGFPKLVPTNILPLPARGHWANQCPGGQNKLGPSPTRKADRARTYTGIAEAMAEQWGGDLRGQMQKALDNLSSSQLLDFYR